MYAATQAVGCGIALDVTNTTHAAIKTITTPSNGIHAMSEYYAHPTVGYHYLQLTEYAYAATATIYADNGTPILFQQGGIGHIWS